MSLSLVQVGAIVPNGADFSAKNMTLTQVK
jgi:hypothetical protein